MRVVDGFLNEAAAGDQVSIVLRQKLDSVSAATMFHGRSPSSSAIERGLSAHIPWVNNMDIAFNFASWEWSLDPFRPLRKELELLQRELVESMQFTGVASVGDISDRFIGRH